MRYLIVDVEATCWMQRVPPERIEIIAIGAVMLASETGPVASDFASLVRPLREKRLSAFCMGLTGIRQREIEAADDFATVFPRFLRWVGGKPYRLCSWSEFDLLQFRADCARHHMRVPEPFAHHIDLERVYRQITGAWPSSVNAALKECGLKPAGRKHRALDDARNIARLAMQKLLPAIV